MRSYKEINLLDNKKLMLQLNIAALILLPLFCGIFWLIIKIFLPITGNAFSLFSLFLYLFLIFIHEGIHAIFFKLFNPKGTVKFGLKNGAAYATSPNSFYSKGKFAVICLAPFFLISLTLFLLCLSNNLSPAAFYAVAGLHGASCVGDFYWCCLLLKTPKNALVEDTEQGLNLYLKG